MKRRMVAAAMALVVAAMTACGGSTGASQAAAGSQEETTAEAADAAGAEAEETEVEATGEAGAETAEPAVPEEQAAPAGEQAASEEQADQAVEAAPEASGEKTEILVFIAASLNTVMQEVAAAYNEEHPEVTITYNADSSGTLLTQIENGAPCDVFFSAAQKQMNKLEEEDRLVVEGSRANVVNNQVVVVTRKDSGTAVTGLSDIAKAESIALADGSVPVGRYTRVAMINAGLLPGFEVDAAADITTAQVSEALGGVEISEQGNVSKVLAAVVEASCEVGTTYYSDTYGYEDQLDILEYVSYDLSGNVIYPIAQVVNEEADETEKAAAADFISFVTGEEAKAIFEAYYFDTDVA